MNIGQISNSVIKHYDSKVSSLLTSNTCVKRFLFPEKFTLLEFGGGGCKWLVHILSNINSKNHYLIVPKKISCF